MNWKLWTASNPSISKTWWAIFIYLAIYLLLSMLKGMVGSFWVSLGQVWLLAGHLMTIWIIYRSTTQLSDQAVKRSWFYIFLAVICFSSGSIIRYFFKWSGISSDFWLAPGDLVFIIGTPLLWFGLLRYPYQSRLKVTRLRSLFDFGLSVVSFTILVIAFMYRPVTSIFQSDL